MGPVTGRHLVSLTKMYRRSSHPPATLQWDLVLGWHLVFLGWHLVLLGFAWLYLVLLGFTWSYMVLLDLKVKSQHLQKMCETW